jgi:pimeloyl-ACP methyl ester carboxylesterase
MRKPTQLATRWIVAICVSGLLVALLQTWIFTNLGADYLVAHGGATRSSSETPAIVGLQYQDVHYDGRLPAWYIKGQPRHPVIVMVPGYGSSRTGMLKIVVPLHIRGYGILVIAQSYQLGWQAYGGGQREATQVTAAAHWVTAHTGSRVVLYGQSAGGLSVLLAGAEGLRPLAIISDSGLTSMRNEAAHNTRVPSALLGPFQMLYPWFSGGAHILDVGSELRLHPGYDVPTLVIQGTDDHTIYWRNGPTLARLTRGTLWLLPGVGHVRAFRTEPTEYIRRVTSFISAAEARAVRR